MKNKLYILFQGFGQTINDWKNTKFLKKLEKNGRVFIYQNKWIEQINDFDLSYLTMDGFIQDVITTLTKKIPNLFEYIWIPIGESFGGCFALTFAILYKKYCNCCVLLDNPPYFTIKNNQYRIKMTEKMLGNKFRKLSEKEFINIKINNPHYLLDYGVISYAKYIKKNIINKISTIPIYGFYNIEFPDKYSKEFGTYENIQIFDEINKLKKFKNFNYYLFINVGHLVYLDNSVINKIFEII